MIIERFNIYISCHRSIKTTANLIRSSTRVSQIGKRLKRTNYARKLQFAFRPGLRDKIMHTAIGGRRTHAFRDKLVDRTLFHSE